MAIIARGCQRQSNELPYIVNSTLYTIEEQSRGAVLNISCKSGFSLGGPISYFRLYCNGSQWLILGSADDLLTTRTDRYQCKS